MDIKDLQKTFSEKLEGLMTEKGFDNISSLSKEINIPRTTIGNWLNLVRTPQIDSLVALSKFFDVTTDYLLGLDD